LPGRGVAHVVSFAYFVGKPTRKRPEAATAHTGGRCALCKEKHLTINLKLNNKNDRMAD